MKMDTVRDNGATTGEPSVLVQKLAYCDTHTPADAETVNLLFQVIEC